MGPLTGLVIVASAARAQRSAKAAAVRPAAMVVRKSRREDIGSPLFWTVLEAKLSQALIDVDRSPHRHHVVELLDVGVAQADAAVAHRATDGVRLVGPVERVAVAPAH